MNEQCLDTRFIFIAPDDNVTWIADSPEFMTTLEWRTLWWPNRDVDTMQVSYEADGGVTCVGNAANNDFFHVCYDGDQTTL